MKQIQLTQGKIAIVDDEDYEYLNQWGWCVNGNNYPMRVVTKNKIRTTITMHRLLMNPPKGMQVDHINGNRLDNRRNNLRVCTQSQNCTSRKAWKINKTGYRGVSKSGNKYKAVGKVNGKKKYLGLFNTPEEAARIYDVYSKAVHGGYAVLNFP